MPPPGKHTDTTKRAPENSCPGPHCRCAGGGLVLVYRPADIYTLSPDLDPVLIDISILRNGGGGDLQNSHLRYEKGDAGFDEALAEIESLRFRRPPINPLFQALPFLPEIGTQNHTIDDYDYHIDIALGSGDSTVWDGNISYVLGTWEYRDYDHSVSLPLTMKDGQTVGKELGDKWWQMAQEIDSDS